MSEPRASSARPFAWLAILILAACVSDPGKVEPPPTSSVDPAPAALAAPRVSFAEGRFGYGDRTIPFPTTIELLSEVLGPPSRSTTGANTIETWDHLGLYCYRKAGEEQVTSINVSFAPQTPAFAPGSCFLGRVEVPGGSIGPLSTFDELRAAGLRAPPGMKTSWSRQLGRYSLGAEWDDGVVDVWLGWRGPAPSHVPGPPLGEDELFTAEARDHSFPFDETLREISHRGNISVIDIEGAKSEGSVGRSFFCAGALCEIARRRGYAYVVSLSFGPGDLIVGFTNDPEPDFVREFPEHAVAGAEYYVMPADMIFDLLGDWPDGGVQTVKPPPDR
jgi:hypothetical protein